MSGVTQPVWHRQAVGRGIARIARARYRAWMDAGCPGELKAWTAAHPIPGEADWSPTLSPRLPLPWRTALQAAGAARLRAMGLRPEPGLEPRELRP